jgi:SAM-dependent methyltransferase
VTRHDDESLYRDGRRYDQRHETLLQDVDFYLGCARRFGDPVLELACGTGRVSIPLAHAGFEVTGIDVSPGMLREARTKIEGDPRAPLWIEGDVRSFSLEKRFALILFPFNAIAHLHTREDVERCFACVRRHLAADGRFVLAIFNPDVRLLARDPDERREVARHPDPDGGGEVIVAESVRYDPTTQINHVRWSYDVGGRASEVSLDMRIFFPQELDALLHYNGFSIERRYGDFDESAFAAASPQQVLVCRVRDDARAE